MKYLTHKITSQVKQLIRTTQPQHVKDKCFYSIPSV